ncbi:MAG: class I SAM-dependent methyltransferase [Holophagaceae bacterium]
MSLRALEERIARSGTLPDLGLGPEAQARCEGLFSRPFILLHAACELYAARVAYDLAGDLGWHPRLRAGAGLEALLEGLHAQSRPPAAWMLDFMADEGLLRREGDRYHLAAEPDFGTGELRAAAEAAAPGCGVNFDLLDTIRRQVPPFFREGRPGEGLLFDLSTLPLWLAYFSNANPEYLPNNVFAALALKDGLPEGARVLELGAGAGSFAELTASEGAREGWLGRVADYRFTDVTPTFLRKAQRELRGRAPGLPLSFQAFDLNRPFTEQGLEPGAFDAILGINVVHVATDLLGALEGLRALLAPGGRLVLGECLKPDLAKPIYLEFFFKFVRSFNDVALDPDYRPAAGFLTPEAWEKALRRAGFASVRRYPDTRALMAAFPTFYVGALSAGA